MIQQDSDVTVRLYRSFVRLKFDIRADEQELNYRFEQAMDAIDRAGRQPDCTWRRTRRALTTATRFSASTRNKAAALAVAAVTAAGGVLQGILGASVCLGVGVLVTGALLAILPHGTPSARGSGRG
ncbi:hypothetical protein ACIP79_41670 [Streptomyces sp. NPDC088747]|uniref:hypothetical protein n=1 Tax=Streptomyces sp. NPDC088747 TaxID=3365886 RepID=UPI003800DDE6